MPATTTRPTGPVALGNTERCLSKVVYSTGDTRTDPRARRTAKYRDQKMLAKYVLAATNISGCGRRQVNNADGDPKAVEVRVDDEAGAYLAGVQWCSSVWFCPRCSPVVLYRRCQEIDRICRTIFECGGSIYLLTLTVRHSLADPAQRLVDFMIPAMTNLTGNGTWHRLSKRLGYIGVARVAEVTWSARSGYHPHIHAALCFDRKLTDMEYGELLRFLRKFWIALVADDENGLSRTIVPTWAVDLREWEESIDPVTDADGDKISGTGEGHGPARYLTKIGGGWGLGSELAGGNVKEAKGRSLNPAQLVSTWVASKLGGHADDQLADVIRELHKATKGRQMTKISHKLRKWVAERTPELDEVEQADDEIVNEEVGGAALAEIHHEVYTWVQRLGAVPDVLEGAEDDGLSGVVEALRNRGLPVIINGGEPDRDGKSRPPTITFGPDWLRAKRSDPTCKVRHIREAQREATT